MPITFRNGFNGKCRRNTIKKKISRKPTLIDDITNKV